MNSHNFLKMSDSDIYKYRRSGDRNNNKSALKLAAMGFWEDALLILKAEGGLYCEEPGKERVSAGVSREYQKDAVNILSNH